MISGDIFRKLSVPYLWEKVGLPPSWEPMSVEHNLASLSSSLSALQIDQFQRVNINMPFSGPDILANKNLR